MDARQELQDRITRALAEVRHRDLPDRELADYLMFRLQLDPVWEDDPGWFHMFLPKPTYPSRRLVVRCPWRSDSAEPPPPHTVPGRRDLGWPTGEQPEHECGYDRDPYCDGCRTALRDAGEQP